MKVYMIQSGKRGPVKIGKANDVDRRLLELQVGNPFVLHIMLILPCTSEYHALAMEKRLHSRFRNLRIRGEWFKPKVLKMIRAMSGSHADADIPEWLTTEDELMMQHFRSI